LAQVLTLFLLGQGQCSISGAIYESQYRDTSAPPPAYTNPPPRQVHRRPKRPRSRARHVCEIRHDPNAGGSGFPAAAGLLSWRGELLYYALEGTAQTFKVLRGSEFAEFPTLSATASTQPFAGVFGGHLVATADDTNEGVHYLQDATASDGFLVTSRLDMDRPGKQKRLSQIAVVLSEAVASFGCKIEYRTDDTAACTDAGTDTNTRRAVASGLSDTFYMLQLRITLDDDTGNNEDVRIDALSVLYSVDA
jgi:hypothetical protein